MSIFARRKTGKRNHNNNLRFMKIVSLSITHLMMIMKNNGSRRGYAAHHEGNDRQVYWGITKYELGITN